MVRSISLSPVTATAGLSNSRKTSLVGAAGVVVFLISLAAAFLPIVDIDRAAAVVGSMMILAGTLEMLAGTLRPTHRVSAIIPGVITIVAGAAFAVEPFARFIPMVHLVIAWLALRAAVLLLTSIRARGSVRTWTLIAAGTDLSLGGILLAGLSASVFPIALFGPTSHVVGNFAFVLAISFVATAMLLIEIATCEVKSKT